MTIERIGNKIGHIDVSISYKIIELFSAGLYSSPNKAFEELVCNSYDAFAQHVAVYVPQDISVDGAYIWVCDDGESMNSEELKGLWRIGESDKRISNDGISKRRKQIGRFGIGKLATYILANNLTYLCKKNGKYMATTMDYSLITKSNDTLQLDERELSESEAKSVLKPYMNKNEIDLVPFVMFGDKSVDAWTFSIMTKLKPKAMQIREGRLKWILSTALPLNPGFKLHYNGSEIIASSINRPLIKKWVIGQDDKTSISLDIESRDDNGKYLLDFETLKGVNGVFELYEDSLVDGAKATDVGRSHGIFLMVRGRLINLGDPLLGMESFSHGAFNRTRIVVHADGLDEYLTSTREAIKESAPLMQLKEYLKKKFNNEVKAYYYDWAAKKDNEQNIIHRMSLTSMHLTKRPLYAFATRFFNNEIHNPFLLEKPNPKKRNELLRELEKDLNSDESIIKSVEWETSSSLNPLGSLSLETGIVKINLMHPYIANNIDSWKSKLPLQFIVITEILTEACLYDLGVDEDTVNSVMKRRDNTLRQLSLSGRDSTPAVAQLLKDTLADSVGLEDSVFRAFSALGYEVSKIGGNGKPDGKAEAMLGYGHNGVRESYSFTYDAKSTTKNRIQAGTTKLSAIKRHQTNYSADFSVVIAIDFEGADKPNSAINQETKQQQVTCIRARDLIKLLFLSGPKQIGLKRLKDMFIKCKTPLEVSEWIESIENQEIKASPFQELLEVVYDLQTNDKEPPEIASIRIKLNEKVKPELFKKDIEVMVESLIVLVPGFVSIEGERVAIQGRPDIIMNAIRMKMSDYPNDLQMMYLDTFKPSK